MCYRLGPYRLKITIILQVYYSITMTIITTNSVIDNITYGRKGPQNPPYFSRAVLQAPGHTFPRSGSKQVF